jgi:hypothetical protein
MVGFKISKKLIIFIIGLAIILCCTAIGLNTFLKKIDVECNYLLFSDEATYEN